MLDTQISAPGGWPTVSARYLDTRREGAYYQEYVYGNSVYKSVSGWWVIRKFFDNWCRQSRSTGDELSDRVLGLPSYQLIAQCPGLLEIGGVEALRKPVVDRG